MNGLFMRQNLKKDIRKDTASTSEPFNTEQSPMKTGGGELIKRQLPDFSIDLSSEWQLKKEKPARLPSLHPEKTCFDHTDPTNAVWSIVFPALQRVRVSLNI